MSDPTALEAKAITAGVLDHVAEFERNRVVLVPMNTTIPLGQMRTWTPEHLKLWNQMTTKRDLLIEATQGNLEASDENSAVPVRQAMLRWLSALDVGPVTAIATHEDTGEEFVVTPDPDSVCVARREDNPDVFVVTFNCVPVN